MHVFIAGATVVLGRRIVDGNLVRLLTRPMPTGHDRFRETFDWAPEYSTYRDGLDQVVEEWRADGIVRDRADGSEWVGEQ